MAKRYLNDEDNVDFGQGTAYKDTAKINPASLTSRVDDYNPTGFQNGDGEVIVSILRMQTDGTGNKQIGGLLAPTSTVGAVVTIVNVGTVDNLVCQNNNANSSANNRFLNNANVSLNPNEAATFWYDNDSLRWRQLNDYK